MRRRSTSTAVGLALMALLVVVGPAAAASPGQAAKNLAIIDGSRDPWFYRHAMDAIIRGCRGSGRTQISDYAANTQRTIRRETGEKVKIATILRGVRRGVSGSSRKVRCIDAFTLYSVLVSADQRP